MYVYVFLSFCLSLDLWLALHVGSCLPHDVIVQLAVGFLIIANVVVNTVLITINVCVCSTDPLDSQTSV